MRLRIDSHTRILDTGTAIAGGSPYAHWRLSLKEIDHLNAWLAGSNVDENNSEQVDLCQRLLVRGMVHPEPDAPVSIADVTVVIPAYNCAALVARTIGLLPNLRIIVVDDGSDRPLEAAEFSTQPTLGDSSNATPAAKPAGSTDNNRAIQSAHSHVRAIPIEVLRCAKNGGPGAARNVGLQAVNTSFVAFIDAGIEIEQASLLELGTWMHPHVSLVAPRVMSAAGHSRWERYDQRRSPIDLGPFASAVLPGARVPYVPGACLFTRTEAVRSVNGFDETLRYGEDVDLVWRLPVGSVRFEPEVQALHRSRTTLVGFARQRFNYGSGAAGLGAKHGKAGAPVCLSPWSAALWALILLRRPAGAAALFGYSIAALARELDSESASKEATRMVAVGSGWAGFALAAAAVRAWWPFTLLALVSRKSRSTALVVAGLGFARRAMESESGNRVNDVAVGAIDDLAAGAGMWTGALKLRSLTCLLPDLEDRTEF